MVIKDNRQFVKASEKTGDLVRIEKEVDWDLEVGAIVRRANEQRGPAVLFEKLKDYPAGYSILGVPLATSRRVAIAMGLKPDTSVKDVHTELERRLVHPLPPKAVAKAPCQQNVMVGDDIDLYRFPTPYIHDGDGGRYIGTWHIVICNDPDSDWVCWSMYRLMLYNQRYISGLWRTTAGIGEILYKKYVPRNKPMPVAIAIGADPLSTLASVIPTVKGLNRSDLAGALLQQPVEVVKCLTSDLMVPAESEIVIEGEIIPSLKVLDGPFGEYTGYRTTGDKKEVLQVKAITHRNNPIFTMTNMGMPADDVAVASAMVQAVQTKLVLQNAGFDITGVYSPPEMANLLTVVGVKSPPSGVATKIESVLHANGLWPIRLMVVDDDVDVFDLNQAVHTLATKCHPVRGMRAMSVDRPSPLLPFLSPQERAGGKSAVALFDCTWPPEWSRETEVPPRASFDDMYPDKIRRKVLRQWKSYGFKD